MSFVMIGRAADAAAVSVDTMRRWIRNGKVRARKNPGGRWLVDLSSLGLGQKPLPQVVGARQGGDAVVNGEEMTVGSLPPSQPQWKSLPPWEQELQAAKAKVARLRYEQEAERVRRQGDELEAEARRRELEEEAQVREGRRLRRLRAFGREVCMDLDAQSAVNRDLEAWVTSEHVPATLSVWEQQMMVEDHVRDVERAVEERIRKK